MLMGRWLLGWVKPMVDIHIYLHSGDITHRLDKIMTILEDIKAKAKATLAKVTSDTDIDNAVAKVVNDQVAQIKDLKAQLAAAIAAGNDPQALQELSDTMDAILAADTANAEIVSKAVTDGTPAATP